MDAAAALGALDIDADARRTCFDGAMAAEARAIAEKLKSLGAYIVKCIWARGRAPWENLGGKEQKLKSSARIR